MKIIITILSNSNKNCSGKYDKICFLFFCSVTDRSNHFALSHCDSLFSTSYNLQWQAYSNKRHMLTSGMQSKKRYKNIFF